MSRRLVVEVVTGSEPPRLVAALEPQHPLGSLTVDEETVLCFGFEAGRPVVRPMTHCAENSAIRFGIVSTQQPLAFLDEGPYETQLRRPGSPARLLRLRLEES